ncbi:3-hydroxyacyl-[acyl-carrier-protein] dehydratase [Tissierella praeacuta DSM 18095]|uniref:3-hydroxyacyl-[acyl-carrier-protein] dehydratase FabZ n=1 Tax=Tissierella praeacuta DSM 18095 TaxID=1123404 RepID=A0A1M4W544_9FIRM|nr:3-hydroxyacyl-ACP dehydratase FabZ [Tissierella praeacuta]TCU75617.1 3-hydroxyacyl-[acyl-carrier-protein] dehydratase [Tissierella praeacuta]SHE76317.1 3-hydroxyacyl-[acyl-carrier-protein] dehydratase [Tissierella praeacuta DSM 18095]SUP00080.1 (3R)-hydroxymyristoyl-[acyl-carrier-protein] dehydratase [Tissierella praeacuta]
MDKLLNIEEIKGIIPHRYPFLFVDKILIEEVGIKGIGYKNVTVNEFFFQGHFPNMPVMPGVLIVESMAQVGAIILLSHEKYKGKTPYFAGINKVRFKRKVVPGDTLRMEVELTRIRGSVGIGQGKAYVEDELACEGEFLFAIE